MKGPQVSSDGIRYYIYLKHIEAGTRWPTFSRRHFQSHFLLWKLFYFIKMSLKFVPHGPFNNIPALVQIMAWRRSGDKPLFEPMMAYIVNAYMRHSASMSKKGCTYIYIYDICVYASVSTYIYIYTPKYMPSHFEILHLKMCGLHFNIVINIDGYRKHFNWGSRNNNNTICHDTKWLKTMAS